MMADEPVVTFEPALDDVLERVRSVLTEWLNEDTRDSRDRVNLRRRIRRASDADPDEEVG
jgi:hypothetical protein